MKITYLLWEYLYDHAIIKSFREAGAVVETAELPFPLRTSVLSTETIEELAAALSSFQAVLQTFASDVVFSVNFFSYVSELCKKESIPYCCWVLQLPNFDLYTASVSNSCNYLCIGDSYLVEKLWQFGLEKVYFLPDAVELEETPENQPEERGVCFLARHPKQVFSTEELSLYSKGYLEAFIHAQRVLYGASILEEGLLYRVQEEFLRSHPIPANILPSFQKLFMADWYLAPACTSLQQNIFLQNYDSLMTIYSDSDFPDCQCEKHPYLEEESKRREVYRKKEFTLVLAPHTLHYGIPKETLEVIAAGGFPISGFQRDYAYFFQKDQNLAYFTSPEEFQQAIIRYGNHYEEREQVRTAAYQTIANGHTYMHRIIALMELLQTKTI